MDQFGLSMRLEYYWFARKRTSVDKVTTRSVLTSDYQLTKVDGLTNRRPTGPVPQQYWQIRLQFKKAG